mmetsp:Transcript_12210/g.18219  ORF Transcript_12210/g.18219 Transcript_12210/m.18219 type:complete len:107 (+) Transcript_12210:417-737(+)
MLEFCIRNDELDFNLIARVATVGSAAVIIATLLLIDELSLKVRNVDDCSRVETIFAPLSCMCRVDLFLDTAECPGNEGTVTRWEFDLRVATPGVFSRESILKWVWV